jgi:hypothetical protein
VDEAEISLLRENLNRERQALGMIEDAITTTCMRQKRVQEALARADQMTVESRAYETNNQHNLQAELAEVRGMRD